MLERSNIRRSRSGPMTEEEGYRILGIVLGWIDDECTGQFNPLVGHQADPEGLLDLLRREGYCMCTTEFGCAACGGEEQTQKVSSMYVDPIGAAREVFIESGYCDNEVEAYDLINQLLDAGVRLISVDEMKKIS